LDGKPTVLRTNNDYVYFYANGPIRIPEWRLASFPDTWLLVDAQIGGGSPPIESGLFTVFTTSPVEITYKQWAKQNSVVVFIMNPWEWEELSFVGYAFFSVMWLYRSQMSFRSSLVDKGSIDLEILETVFNLYGPTARNPLICAQQPENVAKIDEAVERAIRNMTFEELQQLDCREDYPDASSKLLCMFAGDKGSPAYRLISPHVGVKLYHQLHSRQRDKIAKMLQIFSPIPETGSAAGWLWEIHCHQILPTKSDLKITSLADGETEVLVLAPLRQADFNVLTAIPKKPRPGYYYQAKRNNTTFDAFSVTHTNQVVLMQFTISPNHPPPQGAGLDELAKVLDSEFNPFTGPPWYFIWVVPCEIQHRIRAKLPTAGESSSWQDKQKMKQYVATLEW
jgi:hypothetical protein